MSQCLPLGHCVDICVVFSFEITNLGAKIKQPVEYVSSSSLKTYRLEISHPDGSGTTCCLLHTYTAYHMLPASIAANAAITRCDICTCDAGLYEGIRFAWINMTLPPSRPFHITGLRLVCQVKPQNWAGKFAAAGDDKLSRIWYLGAYTVKVNLLADQFGSILIYRGVCTAHIVCPPLFSIRLFRR